MELPDLFRQFAAAECKQEPLYAELCTRCAADDRILSLLDAADSTQRRPNLLLAAVHLLLLRGHDHPLARYYPSVVAEAIETDAHSFPAFQDFCARHHDALRDLIATRTTQTNEVGRCAGLLPVLQQITQFTGRPLALIDIGTSAGLNLGVDLYRYEFPGHPQFGNVEAEVVIRTLQTGALPIPVSTQMPTITSKFGIDIAPIDVADDDQVLWLRACIWPHDTARAERFRAAVAVMRAHPVALQTGDPIDLIEPCLRRAAADTSAVIFNSWVMTYFDASLRSRYRDMMEKLVREQGVFWVSAEAPGVVGKGVAPPLPPDADLEIQNGTLWTICMREADGAIAYRVVARSHPHGKWLEWIEALTRQEKA